jgi:hypothetical protein
MPAVEIGDFHRDRQGRFLIGYLPQLMTGSDPMIASLLLAVLDRLEPSFPEQAKVIGVLKTIWRGKHASCRQGKVNEYVKIGQAKGPGDHPHEFYLSVRMTTVTARSVSLSLRAPWPGGPASGARAHHPACPVRLFPDSFMASPEVSPAEIAAAVGYIDDEDELFEVSVAVMGHFDPLLGAFVNPRVLPRSGSPVYLVPSEMLTNVLSKRKRGDRGSAHVGWLLSRGANVPITLDVNEFTSTHLSIIAGTGSGKSYLAGVTIEELMKPQNKACVLIADPHGEYSTLEEMQNDSKFCADGYRPKVRIMKPHQVKVRLSNLTLDDVRYLLPTLGERMEWILTEAYSRVQKVDGSAYDRQWTIEDLINMVQDIGRTALAEKGVDYSSSVEGLIWRLDRRFRHSQTFDDNEHLDLNRLFQPGQCTVLQLNEIDQRDQQVIIATLLRRVLKARMDTERARPTRVMSRSCLSRSLFCWRKPITLHRPPRMW